MFLTRANIGNFMNSSLLQVQDLHVTFETRREQLQVLCGVSFEMREGEIFGLVGESGCGKSMTGLSILRLIPSPGRITAGQIVLRGENLLEKSEAGMRSVRGAAVAAIFQDPTSSLNPVFQIGAQLVDVLHQHQTISKAAARQQVISTLEAVGLPDVERIYKAYPHELSGGMQQRVMIAMALVCRPALLIADEPTTALDVTIQAQILQLLRDLRDSTGISILLITHDLGVVAQMCDRVAVLYAGRVVEMGSTSALFNAPQHPYTQSLLAAIPTPAQRGRPLAAIQGKVPHNPGALIGCAFAERCPVVFERCRTEQPALLQVEPHHTSACLRHETGEVA
jgi:peptide/nickel transport system ATP-binding protein